MNMATIGLLNSTANFVRFRKHEQAVRAGANATAAASLQSMARFYALDAIGKLVATLESTPPMVGQAINLSTRFAGYGILAVGLAIDAKFIAKKIQWLRAETSLGELFPPNHNSMLSKGADYLEAAFTFTHRKLEEYPQFKRILHYIHASVGPVLQVSMAAAALGVCSQAITVGTAATLVFIALDFLCQQGLLPSVVRRTFDSCLLPTTIATRLLTGTSYLEKIVLFGDLLYVGNQYLTPLVEALTRQSSTKGPVTGQAITASHAELQLEFEKIAQNYAGTPNHGRGILVNPDHIRKMEIREAPDINLKEAIPSLYQALREHRQQDQIPGEADIKVPSERYIMIRAGVGEGQVDEKLVAEIDAGKVEQTYEGVQAYIEEGLILFAKRIEDKQILEGELSATGYQNVQQMGRGIVHVLQQMSQDMTENHLLIEDVLVIFGLTGHYCGSGFSRAVEELYESYVAPTDVTLQEKIHNCLRALRGRRFECYYQMLRQIIPTIDTQDIHHVHRRTNLIGRDLGLPHAHGASSGNDSSEGSALLDAFFWIAKKVAVYIGAMRDTGLPFILEYSLQSPLYSDEVIMAELTDAFNDGRLPYQEIESWFVNWLMERHRMSKDVSTNIFREEILSYETRTEVNDVYLKAMLVEMGIFKLPEDSPVLLSNQQADPQQAYAQKDR